MSEHVMLSPSRRPKFKPCPGSVREEAKYLDVSGPAAIDGTHTHTLIEHCLKNGKMPLDLVGVELEDHEGKFIVDKERATRAKVATDYVRLRVSEIGAGVRVVTESRVDPAPLVGRFDMSGTVDIQILSPLNLEIVDYKDGTNPVSPDDPQLEQYAVGALAQYGADRFKSVTLTVIQPKLALKGGKDTKVINSTSRTVDVVLGWAEDLKREAAAVDDPNAPLVPGERQCKYCLHRGACSARAKMAVEAVGMLFSSVETQPMNAAIEGADAIIPSAYPSFAPVAEPAPRVELSHQAAQRDPATMTPQQVRETLEAAPLIRQFLASVEEEAEKRLLRGEIIPGLKLVSGRGSRKWNLDDDQIVEKLKGMGIPKDACYTVKVISPAQAEKVTWEKRDGTKMQLTDRQLKRMEQEYITHLAGKPTIALEADSRPAIMTDASPLFSSVAPPVADTTPDWLK